MALVVSLNHFATPCLPKLESKKPSQETPLATITFFMTKNVLLQAEVTSLVFVCSRVIIFIFHAQNLLLLDEKKLRKRNIPPNALRYLYLLYFMAPTVRAFVI